MFSPPPPPPKDTLGLGGLGPVPVVRKTGSRKAPSVMSVDSKDSAWLGGASNAGNATPRERERAPVKQRTRPPTMNGGGTVAR